MASAGQGGDGASTLPKGDVGRKAPAGEGLAARSIAGIWWADAIAPVDVCGEGS